MRLSSARLSFGLVALTVFAASCGEPAPPSATQPLGSRLELVAGDVFLVTQSAKERMITGAMLPGEAELLAMEGGRALLRLSSGTAVFLRGGSKVRLKGEALELLQGELWADVPSGEDEMARISAGSASVSAAGAGLDVAIDGGKVSVYVARGLAVVSAKGGRAEVHSGERVIVEKEGAPKPQPVDFWVDWTGGMADRELGQSSESRGAGKLYGIDRDRASAPPAPLQILSQKVQIVIRDGVAETTVDQQFFNPTSSVLEGWYWFGLPEDAAVTRFALEVNGSLVEGEMIERKQAAAAYEEAVQSAFDPALLEWIDGRTFRARIYPVPAAGQRRIVLSYTQLLPLADGVYRYVYPMGSSKAEPIQEFALDVDLGEQGADFEVATLEDARLEQDKKSLSMRRSGFSPRSDFLLELTPKDKGEAVRAMRYSGDGDEAAYVMVRYSPEVSFDKLDKVPGDVVVVLDTSAGGDEADRSVRDEAAEAILRALSKGDRFAVVATDLQPRVVFPEKGLSEVSDATVSEAMERLSEVASGGATDLGAMFSKALDLLHGSQQPAVVYVGDGRATVGERSSKELADRLRRALSDSRARLFTLAVGMDANTPLLERLARVGAGRMFRVDTPDQSVQEALRFVGMLKTPTLTELEIDAGSGLDQVMSTSSGKLTEGDEVVLLARSHHGLPKEIKVSGKLGQEAFEQKYSVSEESGDEYGYIPSLWARAYLERLQSEGAEENRGQIIALGIRYSLMTPFSSFLVLESNAAHDQQGLQRQPRFRLSDAARREESGGAWALASQTFGGLLAPMGCSSEAKSEAPPHAEEANAQRAAPVESKPESVMAPADGAPPSPAPSESQADPPSVSLQKGMRAKESASGGGEGYGSSGAPLGGMADKKKSSDNHYGIKGPRDRRRSDEEVADDSPGGSSSLGTAFNIANPYGVDRDSSGDAQFSNLACSDASTRSLSERRVLWTRRTAQLVDASALANVYFEAGKSCELPAWRDRKALLDVLEPRAATAEQVQGLLAQFTLYPKLQTYLKRRVLRRVMNPDMLVLHGGVDWSEVRRTLGAIDDPDRRVEQVKAGLARDPQDPVGLGLLVEALAEADRKEEAFAAATRLRRDGQATPAVLTILCDLLADSDRIDEARRTCSELVEWSPEDPAARQKLGDLFLRHGWYEEAYRQYESLVAMSPTPVALLRLAAAAAGQGRIDEALRIERQVASGDGEPGPDDPRRLARLHSAARLAAMILEAKGKNEQDKVKELERSLKRTAVFETPTTIVLFAWEDLEASLSWAALSDDRQLSPLESALSADTGIAMFDLGASLPPKLEFKASLETLLRRPVPLTVYTIHFDGKTFDIKAAKGQVERLAPTCVLSA
ncbi:MAG: VWA domain-containing protein [Myxococcota bacterium]|jgi:tetratricopeptide (TPR) repeat protein/Mg-chelatase subunit ChlD|nr:VWA domain-containing protein [Myxococcota bacterium]